MARELDLDEFLNHSSSDRSGGRLDRWKKKEPPKINTWLARKPIALWQHSFPKIVVIEDKKTDKAERRVWSGDYNCHEDEDVLKVQYKRDDDGEREHPPEKCGFCKTVEWFREQVETGKLDMLKPIFKFVGDREDETRVIHAGGFYGGFKEDNMEEADIERFRKSGLKFSDAWNENAYAKLKYLFCIVDNDDVAKGVQTTTETGLLGDKVKDVINDMLESEGPEEGNPFRNPYCIQWEYKPKEKDPKNKYKARPMSRFELTPEIEKHLKAKPADISFLTDPFDAKTLRATMERHCLVKNVPWDELFGKASKGKAREEAEEDRPRRSKREEPEEEEEDRPAAKKGAAAKKATRTKPKPEPEPEPEETEDEEEEEDEEDDGKVQCDDCDNVMDESDTECSKCGAEYDPKTGKKVKAGRAKRSARKRSEKPASDDDDAPAELNEDDIPF